MTASDKTLRRALLRAKAAREQLRKERQDAGTPLIVATTAAKPSGKARDDATSDFLASEIRDLNRSRRR